MDASKTIDVLQYEGGNDVLVWKHPKTDFFTGAQLVVHESQEAILYLNGEALDLFGPGRHTLETQNLPALSKLMRRPLGDKTAFHCEVYFVNKVTLLDILWGTAAPIPVQDPAYQIILPVRANGQFGLRVENSRKLLVKLVGTTAKFDKETLHALFRGMLMTNIKDYLSRMMVERKISFLEVHAHIQEASEALRTQITPLFEEFGFAIANFYVNSISVPEDDPGYQRIRTALAAAKERELLARGKRAEMDIVGYTYQQQRTFEVLDKAAANEGAAGTIMGAGMGLGMGFGVGGTVGGAMADAARNVAPGEGARCAACGAALPPGAQFCPACGAGAASAGETVCPVCGKPVKQGNFCLHCGALLKQSCQKCGKPLPAGAKFCPACGETVKEG